MFLSMTNWKIKIVLYSISFSPSSQLYMRWLVGLAKLAVFHARTVSPKLCTKILPGSPTTRSENITRLLPGYLLPGPGIAKPAIVV